MIATNNGSRLLVLVAGGLALAGCDSIKDVRSDPSTELPARTAVLAGHITGLGSKRALALINNGDVSRATSFTSPIPTATSEQLQGVTPFTFGTYPEGSAYNVQVHEQPTGKTCTVTNGTGTLSSDTPSNVMVTCVDSAPRYNLTVTLNPAFAGAAGAQVVLATEEAIYRISPAATDTSVTFSNVLFNPAAVVPPGTVTPGFEWSVTASTTVGGGVNKCPVTNPTNVAAGVVTNPAGHVTGTSVARCSFAIGGTVNYSPPAAGAPTPAAPSGLALELRSLKEEVVATQAFSGAWAAAFTFNEGATPTQFVSNRDAIYYVAVATHPAGMRCVVVNPMAILFAPTLTSNPADITAPSVQCREVPATSRQLRGVYRLVSSTWQSAPSAAPVTSTWAPANLAVQNTASSNVIAFFENGTFLYGTHANSVQVEHGFYDYDPVAATLRFTLNVDTNNSSTFPFNFSPAQANSPANTITTTNGLSAVPGTVLVGAVRHAVLNGVAIPSSTPRRITGRFSGSQTLSTTPASTVPTATLDWVLEEPPSIADEMTGTWVSQDERRLWVFDRDTYYGAHVGVVGVITMNDSCFTMEDVTASSSFYTRRGSLSGCYPWNRPATGQTYTFSGAEAVDIVTPTSIGTGAGSVTLGSLPEFMARLPGGQSALDGRSPSPIFFHIAPPATFFASAPSEFFQAVPTGWCNTQMLGIRSSLNGVPIHKPVYFCRVRAP